MSFEAYRAPYVPKHPDVEFAAYKEVAGKILKQYRNFGEIGAGAIPSIIIRQGDYSQSLSIQGLLYPEGFTPPYTAFLEKVINNPDQARDTLYDIAWSHFPQTDEISLCPANLRPVGYAEALGVAEKGKVGSTYELLARVTDALSFSKPQYRVVQSEAVKRAARLPEDAESPQVTVPMVEISSLDVAFYMGILTKDQYEEAKYQAESGRIPRDVMVDFQGNVTDNHPLSFDLSKIGSHSAGVADLRSKHPAIAAGVASIIAALENGEPIRDTLSVSFGTIHGAGIAPDVKTLNAIAKNPETSWIKTQAELAAEIMRDKVKAARSVVASGHSLGGAMALLFAEANSDVAMKLVMNNPVGFQLDDDHTEISKRQRLALRPRGDDRIDHDGRHLAMRNHGKVPRVGQPTYHSDLEVVHTPANFEANERARNLTEYELVHRLLGKIRKPANCTEAVVNLGSKDPVANLIPSGEGRPRSADFENTMKIYTDAGIDVIPLEGVGHRIHPSARTMETELEDLQRIHQFMSRVPFGVALYYRYRDKSGSTQQVPVFLIRRKGSSTLSISAA